MSQEEQSKKTSQVKSDAAVKEVNRVKPTGELSNEDLDKVAGGLSPKQEKDTLSSQTAQTITVIATDTKTTSQR